MKSKPHLAFPPEQRASLKLRFPDLFWKDPQSESLVGTTWVLANREDPDGLLERLLPGEKLKFTALGLTCGAESDTGAQRRYWEMESELVPSPFLSVYNLQSGGNYTGACLSLTQGPSNMVLGLQSVFKHDASRTLIQRYQARAAATYGKLP